MIYIKQTLKQPYTGGNPYQSDVISREEATHYVSEDTLLAMEKDAQNYQGTAHLIEVKFGLYIGVKK